jgi:hypothetical protein
MNLRYSAGALALVLAVAAAPSAWAAAPIAQIKTLSGEAAIVHDGVSNPAQPGSHIYTNDTLTTGPGASMGVTFTDNTTMSLGAESRLTVDEFVYDVANGDASFGASVLGGVMSMVSGDIAKMHPENAHINTPLATIGIRGTRFVVRVENTQ